MVEVFLKAGGCGYTEADGLTVLKPGCRPADHVDRPALGDAPASVSMPTIERRRRLMLVLIRPIRWDIVAEQYDQMIKYMAAGRGNERAHRLPLAVYAYGTNTGIRAIAGSA